MNNSDSQLSSNDGFINLEELLKLIKKSKLLIAIVTFFFTIAVPFYSSLQPHLYETELRVNLGITPSAETQTDEFNEDLISVELLKVKNSLNFYWPNASVDVFIPSFLKIKYIGSKEIGRKIIDEIIFYLEKEENSQNRLKRNKLGSDISFLIKKKEKIDEEFNRLSNLDQVTNHDSLKDVFMSELLIKKNNFQLEIDELEKEFYENNLSYTVSTEVIKKFNLYIQVLLGLISGLIFSLLIILFKSIKLNLKQD